MVAGRWFGVGLVAGFALLAASCGTGVEAGREAGVDGSSPGFGGLPGLVSVVPAAGFTGGGGGLAGGVWTVPGMPGAGGVGDKGVGADASESVSVGGVRVRLTALPVAAGSGGGRNAAGSGAGAGKGTGAGGGVRFVVRDVARVSDSDSGAGVVFDSDQSPGVCRSGPVFECVVAAGVLAVGGAYRVDSTVNNVTDQRLFTVSDMPAVSGAFQVGVSSQEIDTGAGSFTLGAQFSTAELGVSAGTATTTGFRAGLPVGWSWQGLPASADSAEVSPAAGFQGYSRLLTVDMGSAPLVLGCVAADPATGVSGCEGLTGQAMGVGFSAVINPDRSVILTDEDSSASWWFNPDGKFNSFAADGSLPVNVEYTDPGSGLLKTVTAGSLRYDLFYNNDSRCVGDPPAGFTPVPDGLVCGWVNPDRDWVRVYYTSPAPGSPPRISRIVSVPATCEGFDPAGCSWPVLAVHDYAWDDHNRPVGVRDGVHGSAVMAGSLSTSGNLADDPGVLLVGYEDTDDGSGHRLSRLASSTNPPANPGQARIVSKVSYAEYADVDPGYAPATRSLTTSAGPVDGSSPTQTSTQTYDDLARPVWTQDVDQTLTGYVWAGQSFLLAKQTRGQTTASVFDGFGRETGRYSGPTAAFPSACVPTNTGVLGTADCAPTDTSNVIGVETVYDDVDQVGAGWAQYWWNNPDFAGPAAAITSTDPVTSLPLTPPAGVGGKWSTRIGGSITLPLTSVGIGLATSDPDLTGLLWINGEVACQLAAGTSQGNCVYDNTQPGTSTSQPLPVRLDLTRSTQTPTPPETKLDINLTDQYQGTGIDIVAGQRFTAPTKVTTTDPLPAPGVTPVTNKTKAGQKAGGKTGPGGKTQAGRKTGSNAAAGVNTSVQKFYYSQVFDSRPSRVVTSSTSAQTPGTFTTTVTQQAERGPNGTSRIVTQTTPDGGKYTTTYWGDTKTPQQSGSFTSTQLDQLGSLADQPQYGKPETVTDPTGRTTTLVYDQWGQLACHGKAGPGISNPDFSCTAQDPVTATKTTTVRGNDGQPDQTTKTSYQFTSDPQTPITVTSTRETSGGDTLTDTSVNNIGGQLLEYTDTLGTKTSYTYNPSGLITGINLAPAKTDKTWDITYAYDQYSRPTKTGINGETAATTSYHPPTASPELAGLVAGVGYGPASPVEGAALSYTYNRNTRLTARTWTGLPGRSAPLIDNQTTTATGRMITSNFDGKSSTFTYDPGMRLTNVNVNSTFFTYGYDQSTRLTCTAPNQPNPGKQPCDQLPEHYQTSWGENDRPVSTTIPGAAIPNENPYTTNGDLTAIGDMNLSYTPTGQLAEATTTITPQKLTRGYDTHDRPTTQTTTTGTTGTTPGTLTTPGTTGTPGTPGLTVTTVGYGYSAPGTNSPAVIYPDDGAPVPVWNLPGGLAATGGNAAITDMSGLWSLPIKSDGSAPSASFTGPYGEYSDFTPRQAEQAFILERIGFSQTRPYSHQLGTFTGADPGIYPGGPQYAYTPGDPINYTDPVGTSPVWDHNTVGQEAANIFIRFLLPILVGVGATFLMGKLSKSEWFGRWAGSYAPLAAAALLGAAWGGIAVAANMCSASGCSTKNINKGAFWTEVGISAFMVLLSGLIAGALYLSPADAGHRGNHEEVQNQLNQSLDQSMLDQQALSDNSSKQSALIEQAPQMMESIVINRKESLFRIGSGRYLGEDNPFSDVGSKSSQYKSMLVNESDSGAVSGNGSQYRSIIEDPSEKGPRQNNPSRTESFNSRIYHQSFEDLFESFS